MINPKDVATEGFRVIAEPSDELPEMCAAWTLPAHLAYFEGHFPGNPTLPGVAMVDLTLELVRKWPGFEKAELAILKSAKFTALVQPGAEIEVRLTRDRTSPLAADGIEWRAEWKLGGSDVSAASFWFGIRSRK